MMMRHQCAGVAMRPNHFGLFIVKTCSKWDYKWNRINIIENITLFIDLLVLVENENNIFNKQMFN